MSPVHLMKPKRATDLRSSEEQVLFSKDLVGGILAGQIAGGIMAVTIMIVFALRGMSPLRPLQIVGSFVYGDASLHGFHLPSVLTGVILHQLAPSALWGLGFGFLVGMTGIRRGVALLTLALSVGIMSWLIGGNILAPLAFQAVHGRDIWGEQMPLFWSWVAHLSFGAGLLTFPYVRRRLGFSPKWLRP